MSGAATNVGIEYQHRVSALVLLATYLQLDLASHLEATGTLIPRTVAFETSDGVDDLRIDCENGDTLYLQMKRSVSLSEQPDSEFVKTLRQFAKVFLSVTVARRNHIHLVLATSTKSSRKIIEEVRKLVESTRINPKALKANPLSKSEQETLHSLTKSVQSIFVAERQSEATESELVAFFQRIFISPLDVESTRSSENAVLMVLASKRFIYPKLVWKYLISSSLTYAGNRLSVTHEALTQIMQKFHVPNGDWAKLEDALSELFRPGISNLYQLPTGKEVVLVEIEGADKVLLMEMRRLDEDGNKRSKFTLRSVRVKSGADYTLLRRFASMEMAERYLLNHPSVLDGKDLALMECSNTRGTDHTPFAIQERQAAIDALAKNQSLSKCLHCGCSTLHKQSYLVEIDVVELPHMVGIVCADHIQPSDRILGASEGIETPSGYAPNIDTSAWLAAMHKGQGLLGGYRSLQSLPSGMQIVLWNFENSFASDYSFCVKLNLADGSYKYSYVRGKIERMPKAKAEYQVRTFNRMITEGKRAGDPWCIGEKSWTFAQRSQLKDLLAADDSLLEVDSTEVSKYSDTLGRVHNRMEFYYAPLCIVRDANEETTVVFSNGVPLISDPYRFPEFVENWKRLSPEINLTDLKLSPLLNDISFDAFMQMVTNDDLVAVVDPTFNEDGTPSGGIVIQSMDRITPRNKLADV